MAVREFYGRQLGAQFGQTGQLGQTGQVGQVGQVGQFGQVGQLGQVGQVGQFGQFGQVGQVAQVGQPRQIGGDVPLLRVLQGEHIETINILRALQSADPEVQRQMFPTLARALKVHLQAEEQELQQMISGIARLAEVERQVEVRNAQIERIISNLQSMQVGTNAWNQNLDELASLFEQHVIQLHQGLFPEIRARFDVSRLQAAENRYINRKLRSLAGQMR